jgi:processive 1,2-diacylglycerol beta-glucosyltransferase
MTPRATERAKGAPSPPPHEGRSAVVTILTSSFGGGHRMVATTVADAVNELRPEWDVEVIDFFEAFVGRRFSRLVRFSYGFSARRAPYLYGGFYRAAQWVGERRRLQSRLNRVGRARLRAYLHTRRPDIVVSTYPTPAAVLSDLKLVGEVDAATVTILTDCAQHSQWVHKGVDLYIVGFEELRRSLIALGVPADRVQASGVPIRPCFTPRRDHPQDGPLLITVGAQGMLRHASGLCRALAQRVPKTVVVCGRDERLRRQLGPLAETLNGALEVHGFVEDIHELCADASILVGKPGGVTVAEALCVGLPMVVYGAIPGQERENERLIVAAGAARSARNVGEACAVAVELLSRPEELRRMARAARALGKPRAAYDAASAIIRLYERV